MKEEHTHNDPRDSNLPDSLRVNSFSVPEDYFENLTNNILDKVAEQKLKDQVSDTGFEVPEGYFEGSVSAIYARVAEQRLKDEVGVDGYQVPTGYFESLSVKIVDRATAQPNIRRLPKRKWVRYTAAAALALFLGFSSYWYLGSTSIDGQDVHDPQASLHKISNDEIVHYLVQTTEGVELIELATYLDNEETTDSSFEIDNQLNDKEIEEYLNYML